MTAKTRKVVLSTGRVALHRILSGDVQEVYLADGGEMSNAEWDEYCAIIIEAKRGKEKQSKGTP